MFGVECSLSSSGRRGIRVHPAGMVGSQGTHIGRSALGHHHLDGVTRLHHEEVAESDFAAPYGSMSTLEHETCSGFSNVQLYLQSELRLSFPATRAVFLNLLEALSLAAANKISLRSLCLGCDPLQQAMKMMGQ
jgi:hypothetical protein